PCAIESEQEVAHHKQNHRHWNRDQGIQKDRPLPLTDGLCREIALQISLVCRQRGKRHHSPADKRRPDRSEFAWIERKIQNTELPGLAVDLIKPGPAARDPSQRKTAYGERAKHQHSELND